VPIDCYPLTSLTLLLCFCSVSFCCCCFTAVVGVVVAVDVTMTGVDDARKNECGVYVCAKCSPLPPSSRVRTVGRERQHNNTQKREMCVHVCALSCCYVRKSAMMCDVCDDE